MRSVELSAEVDILVSELLGSFGDNELSPECLDGAMRLLKRKCFQAGSTKAALISNRTADGISIPSAYTAFLTPLTSPKLFCDVHLTSKDEKLAETPYVVLFNAVNILSNDGKGRRGQCGGRVQSCWSFEHPSSNVRFSPQGTQIFEERFVQFLPA